MRARILAFALVVVAGVLAYCYFVPDQDPASTGTESIAVAPSPGPVIEQRVDVPEPLPPDREANQSADEAARQGLTVAFTWYPSVDSSQNDAYTRAQEWMTEQLRARTATGAVTDKGPGAQWTQWALQHAKVIAEVTVGCSGCPEDTDTTVHRAATIKQTAVTDVGTDTVDPDTTVWVTIVRQNDRWLIDDIRY
ncbi:hypothetical protein [Rhodococcoides fascians]|uniref:hypothetical protein n=1 Tax=Rhodococcoides fascians TaxID=1828 RepID=UPI00050C06DF|nr:hypothetical protein [Rhodococcus fascians]